MFWWSENINKCKGKVQPCTGNEGPYRPYGKVYPCTGTEALYRPYGKVHPCTGTEALYRPYGTVYPCTGTEALYRPYGNVHACTGKTRQARYRRIALVSNRRRSSAAEVSRAFCDLSQPDLGWNVKMENGTFLASSET
jgi:sulfatase maturation enzyme AslB (radical SAM superfamily)